MAFMGQQTTHGRSHVLESTYEEALDKIPATYLTVAAFRNNNAQPLLLADFLDGRHGDRGHKCAVHFAPGRDCLQLTPAGLPLAGHHILLCETG